jgi:hypothetical protein
VTIAYLCLALWFYVFDMITGEIAGVKRRPIAGALFALVWPVSMVLQMLGAAIVVGSYREKERLRNRAQGGEP